MKYTMILKCRLLALLGEEFMKSDPSLFWIGVKYVLPNILKMHSHDELTWTTSKQHDNNDLLVFF